MTIHICCIWTCSILLILNHVNFFHFGLQYFYTADVGKGEPTCFCIYSKHIFRSPSEGCVWDGQLGTLLFYCCIMWPAKNNLGELLTFEKTVHRVYKTAWLLKKKKSKKESFKSSERDVVNKRFQGLLCDYSFYVPPGHENWDFCIISLFQQAPAQEQHKISQE